MLLTGQEDNHLLLPVSTPESCITLSILFSITRPSFWNKDVSEQGLWGTQ